MRTRPASPVQQRRTERRDRHQRRTAREQREQIAGGTEDSAFYACACCGHGFAGDVSTHVACPRCGADQDW